MYTITRVVWPVAPGTKQCEIKARPDVVHSKPEEHSRLTYSFSVKGAHPEIMVKTAAQQIHKAVL
jgi:hypothetical protein